MKKIFICFAAIAALAASCQKENSIECQTEGVVNIQIDPGVTGTRADPTPDLTAHDYETVIRSVDVLIFNSKGQLDAYHHAGTSLSGIKLRVPVGKKDIWTVINGPDLSGITTLEGLKAFTTRLDDNIISGDGKGFIMVGHSSWDVYASTEKNTCTIEVSRFTTRVALKRVDLRLPESYDNAEIIIKNVMLINVVAMYNYDLSITPSVWYNKRGVNDSKEILDGSEGREAECPVMTYRAVGETLKNGSSLSIDTPWYFYGYPNPSMSNTSNGDGSFRAGLTRLVVAVEINGTMFYYPITFSNFMRNCAYEVGLTIEGLGSNNPDVVPEKASLQAVVSVKPWGKGSVINENI